MEQAVHAHTDSLLGALMPKERTGAPQTPHAQRLTATGWPGHQHTTGVARERFAEVESGLVDPGSRWRGNDAAAERSRTHARVQGDAAPCCCCCLHVQSSSVVPKCSAVRQHALCRNKKKSCFHPKCGVKVTTSRRCPPCSSIPHCCGIYGHALRGPHPPKWWEAAPNSVVWVVLGLIGNPPSLLPFCGVGSRGWESPPPSLPGAPSFGVGLVGGNPPPSLLWCGVWWGRVRAGKS